MNYTQLYSGFYYGLLLAFTLGGNAVIGISFEPTRTGAYLAPTVNDSNNSNKI